VRTASATERSRGREPRGVFFFELSGEHPTLPAAEALSSARAEDPASVAVASGPGYIAVEMARAAFIDAASRIALAWHCGPYLGSCHPSDVEALASSLELPEGTVAVRIKRYGESFRETDAARLAARAGGALGRKVDLTDPEVEVRILLSDEAHFFISEASVDRQGFEARHVAQRPFFSPISLHPKYSRALVNLTGVKRGGTLLDPFCGTGGVLLEAASIGVRAIGSDISQEMIDGCRVNLDHFDLDAELVRADVSDIGRSFDRVDAVATDPPYGRSATTMRESLTALYPRALASIASVLNDGSLAGVVLPIEAPPASPLTLESTHVQRVHRSLTRRYFLLRKVR